MGVNLARGAAMDALFSEIFSLSGLFTLAMLLLLQAVLGFDNLLYISIESKRVGPDDAPRVRRWGILLAVGLRIVLLVVIVNLFGLLAAPLFEIGGNPIMTGEFTLQALVTLIGGGFIIYTAVKEITHLLSVDAIDHDETAGKTSVARAVALIVTMNLVFSFDSILSAMAIANEKTVDAAGNATAIDYQVGLMTLAILISGALMLAMADYVADFLKRNRMYEVLGLFILFLVGALLVTEGAHLAHLTLFGFEIDALSKSSFYLVVFVLIVTDVISTRFQKRLWARRMAELKRGGVKDG